MRHSKAYHPQTNCLIEQANLVLKEKIYAWMEDNQSTEWYLGIAEALLAMNRQVHSATKVSQFEAVFLRKMPDRRINPNMDRVTMELLEDEDWGDSQDAIPEITNILVIFKSMETCRLPFTPRSPLQPLCSMFPYF